MSAQTINLTPSPEILEVIAEVDLQIHHCLAELIDNCLDELRQVASTNDESDPRVDVTVPTGKVSRDSSIFVGDNGRGMGIDQLEHALRAGSSGKQMLGSLGMFGMGFNIASARLGSLTEVRTGRSGDDEWVVASIDIRKMIEEGTYTVPIRTEPKAKAESGTLIRVTHLKDDIVTKLSSGRAKRDISTHLGRIYTYMLRDPHGPHSGAAMMGGENIRLYVNGTSVQPLLPCIWDPARSVTYKGTAVPAASRIDFPLTDAFACMTCGRWFVSGHDTCTSCGGTDIQIAERRIWGWIGVQRYTDNADFGFSFFRQGRCLVHKDKELFSWQTPDGNWEVEYPVEIGGGRLVGEIHMDFAKPQVRKTDFDRQSRDWHEMRELIKGLGPLRPNIAKARGYAENTSVLGRYFNAFRRNDPGVKLLVPGNGRTATTDLARDWARSFQDGDPDFLTDERWFDAATEHDRIKAGPAVNESSVNQGSDADDWLEGEGLGDLDDPVPTPRPDATDVPTRPETEEERFARYREASALLPETNREVRIESVRAILRVYRSNGVDLAAEARSRQFAIRLVDGEVEVYVDENAPLVRDFGWNILDTALVCAAPGLKDIYRFRGTVDELVIELLDQFPDRRVSAAAVSNRAGSMLEAIRDLLLEVSASDPDRIWASLSPSAKRTAENTAISAASDIDWLKCVASGEFVRYIGADGVHDLVVDVPELIFDGTVFRSTYSTLGDATQQDQIERIAGLLGDLRRMLSTSISLKTAELQRFLLSAELLDSEIAAE